MRIILSWNFLWTRDVCLSHWSTHCEPQRLINNIQPTVGWLALQLRSMCLVMTFWFFPNILWNLLSLSLSDLRLQVTNDKIKVRCEVRYVRWKWQSQMQNLFNLPINLDDVHQMLMNSTSGWVLLTRLICNLIQAKFIPRFNWNL